jgi:hypothetical protein
VSPNDNIHRYFLTEVKLKVSGRDAMRYFQESGYRILPSRKSMRLPSKSCPRITRTPSAVF